MEGKHHVLMARKFNVLATFDDTEAGEKAANEYMKLHPHAAVLEVIKGQFIILADKHDDGVPVEAT